MWQEDRKILQDSNVESSFFQEKLTSECELHTLLKKYYEVNKIQIIFSS